MWRSKHAWSKGNGLVNSVAVEGFQVVQIVSRFGCKHIGKKKKVYCQICKEGMRHKWWSSVAKYQDIIDEHSCKRFLFYPRLLADKLNVAYFLKYLMYSLLILLRNITTASLKSFKTRARNWDALWERKEWKKELMCDFAKIDVNYLPRKCLFLTQWLPKTSLLPISLQTGISLTWYFA